MPSHMMQYFGASTLVLWSAWRICSQPPVFICLDIDRKPNVTLRHLSWIQRNRKFLVNHWYNWVMTAWLAIEPHAWIASISLLYSNCDYVYPQSLRGTSKFDPLHQTAWSPSDMVLLHHAMHVSTVLTSLHSGDCTVWDRHQLVIQSCACCDVILP